ncbi:YbaB/EbfC family nucleoid-associated protein [Candidatus Riflebacteria bacterium]
MQRGGPNMNHMMKQAMKWRENLVKVQEELKSKTIQGAAGGGAIKVTVNGANRLEAIEIDPEVIDPDDAETLQELIVLAANNALEEMAKISEKEMGKITGGMNLPGLF